MPAVAEVVGVPARRGRKVDTITPVNVDIAFLEMCERVATNPNVDVVKLSAILDMKQQLDGAKAKAEFDAAFAEMQGDIPIITKRGEILVRGELRSKFAKLEDILRVVRPVLQAHGFGLRFKNEELDGGRLQITGILSHRGGHRETDEFKTAPDDSGAKNKIQEIGSARSYGQRYTTISLLNIVTENEDNDGQSVGKPAPTDAPAPDGFDVWMTTLSPIADRGLPLLMAAFNHADQPFRKQLLATAKPFWEELKARAEKVGAR